MFSTLLFSASCTASGISLEAETLGPYSDMALKQDNACFLKYANEKSPLYASPTPRNRPAQFCFASRLFDRVRLARAGAVP